MLQWEKIPNSSNIIIIQNWEIMSATSSASDSAPLNPPVVARKGRRPRPKTLKRKLQNREAQRKYRRLLNRIKDFSV